MLLARLSTSSQFIKHSEVDQILKYELAVELVHFPLILKFRTEQGRMSPRKSWKYIPVR